MLTITVDDSAFRQYLSLLQERLGDLTEPMGDIGQALETRIRNRFESKTDPAGAAWAPWADSTLRSYPWPGSKAAENDDGPGEGQILIRYRALLQGISHEPDSTSVRVGFDQDYAKFHEFGTKKMPRRGLLFDDPDAGKLAADDERAVLDVLEHWLGLT